MALWLCALSAVANASQPPPRLAVKPLLGAPPVAGAAWTGYQVLVDNRAGPDRELQLSLGPLSAPGSLDAGPPRPDEWHGTFSQLPVSVEAGELLSVQMFAVGPQSGRVAVWALDAQGRVVSKADGFAGDAGSPLVLQWTRSGKLSERLEGQRLPEPLLGVRAVRSAVLPSLLEPAPSLIRARTLTAGSDGASALPLLAAGYSALTLLLMDGDFLAHLEAPRHAVLADWVLSGGVLAIVPSPGLDLSAASLAYWFGANPEATSAAQSLTDPLPLRVETLGAGTQNSKIEAVTLSGEHQRRLRSYTGGNLAPSPWGGSASFGLGEVHLLGFDPNDEAWTHERWTELKLLDLMGHAWERRRAVILPHAQQDPRDVRAYGVRQYLRQASNRHWALWTAASLFIVLALVLGPLNFEWSRRQGRPLLAYRRVLIGTLLSGVLLFGITWVVRSQSRRATHLTFWEAGAGMSRATATRFRAFHTASLHQLEVSPLTSGSLLAIANPVGSVTGRLQWQQTRPRLVSLDAKPWQTLLVREDGFTSLGAGVSLLRDPQGELLIANRLGKDLSAVLVRDESGKLAYFSELRDGARVRFDAGRLLARRVERSQLGSSSLGLMQIEHLLDDTAPGLAQAWDALDELSRGDVDWWPSDVPSLLAQVNGGEGQLSDSGLPLTQDRVLLRVVGFGGEP